MRGRVMRALTLGVSLPVTTNCASTSGCCVRVLPAHPTSTCRALTLVDPFPRAPHSPVRYSWMFAVAEGNATAFAFPPAGPGAGGHQGGEGADAAAEWWVEGLFEELDAPNEYYVDSASTPPRLFLVPNASDLIAGEPPPDVDVPTLSTFFSVVGTPAAPVVNVTFAGLAFESGAPTFMAARGVPSGGDWALERDGILFFEGTEGTLVQGCSFSRIDGNAVFFSGYNRRAVVDRNAFALLGQSAVALWGRADGFDGTGGEQPRGTRVTSNLAHDLGLLQKQSSFFFSAVACESVVADNVVYDIPRAALNFVRRAGGRCTAALRCSVASARARWIPLGHERCAHNAQALGGGGSYTCWASSFSHPPHSLITTPLHSSQDDAFGGGNVVEGSILFNTCRESSDHAAINSCA